MDIKFPDKLACLFQPKRYKVLYGGRGAGRSWGVSRALLLRASTEKTRILCTRELQNSMKDSVHKLLKDQIELMELPGYKITDTSIENMTTGSEFMFEGIRHNTNKIRSIEGVDLCWVEEAAKVSKSSWEILTPTIRKPDSEIWLTFNPELEEDYTYQFFVLDPPKESTVVKMTFRDNPWFPEVLVKDLEELKRKNYNDYLHVWEGECKQILEGAVFGKELREARLDQRIGLVPYERLVPVDTFWDLGRMDMTAIWFGQYASFQFRFIDYYQNSGQHLDHYLQVLQNRGYTLGTVWLPHDAKAKTLGTKRSIEEQVREKGFKVRIVPNLKVWDGINAARTIFPNSWFDQRKCADGLQCLKHYRYSVDENTGKFSNEPVHDQYSHGADAFRYAGVGFKAPKSASGLAALAEKAKRTIGYEQPNPLGWMG